MDEQEPIEDVATGFDDPDEETSPEVVKRSNPRRTTADPIAVIASPTRKLRGRLCDLLHQNGWETVDVKSTEELLEVCRAVAPEVVLVDEVLANDDNGGPIPEAIRLQKPGAARRIIALLHDRSGTHVAAAMAEGYDDFVLNPDDDVEVVARTTSNLRDCRTLAEIQAQKRDAATLLELSQTLASSLDMQLILHMVSRLIANVLQVERCSIIILDPEHEDAVMVAASEDRKVRDIRIQLRDYPELQRCVANGAPIIIEDASRDPMFQHLRGAGSPIQKVRLMALFPIVFEERVTGVLFLRSHHVSRALSPHELQFGQTVASACAVAIRNARLFDSFRDQTERINYMRMAAEKQMEALRKYEDFFEYAADGMAIVDLDANMLYVNREGRRLMGNASHHFRGENFLDVVSSDSRANWALVVDEVRHGRFKNEMDFIIARTDGEERIFSLSAGGAGQDTGLIILSFRDVTETREMGVELRTTKDFLENLIDNSVDAITASDMSGNLMLFNKGAEKIYGYTADDVIGQMHVSELYPPRVAMEVMRQLRDDRWGGVGRLEAQRKYIRNAAGEFVPVSMTASIIYEDGEEVATVGVFTDLRDRLKIEAELSSAQEELMRTEKARVAAELAGMAAHELNQPLTSVLGYAEMLQHKIPVGQTKVRRHVETIYRQAERMAEIVRRIGQITKYETTNYSASTRILSLEGSAPVEDEAGGFVDVQTYGGADDDLENPQTVRVGPEDVQAAMDAARRSRGSGGDLAAMLGRGNKNAARDVGSVVRLDTVDDDDTSRNRRARRRIERMKAEENTDPNRSRRSDEVTSPGRELPASLSDEDFASPEPEEVTNPGVRMSDLKRAHDEKSGQRE